MPNPLKNALIINVTIIVMAMRIGEVIETNETFISVTIETTKNTNVTIDDEK